ncbi:Acid phosphatase [Grifola frondosa]|uniref:Acid phosphatase n=1 Tax=Grifola frondosa TaxID=5627 RepID=A0A1C7MFK5_GRIFR|nr:Acid phosphatase [Grifola frondosa]
MTPRNKCQQGTLPQYAVQFKHLGFGEHQGNILRFEGRWTRCSLGRTRCGEFGSVPVGAPYFGQDQHNPDLFYFNGTPAATVLFGLDVIVPQHFGSKPVDLVVSGPNEGQNNGPFIFTTSGTIGATYASVERGLPAVAFSAGNSTHRSFTTNTGKKDDPANLAGQVVAKLVIALAKGVNTKQNRLLPLGIGLTVNLPIFGPGNDCTEPPFILTRLTGGATIDKISISSQTGFPTSSDLVAPGLNTPINGIISLPGETPTSAKCETAVSIFSVDYDAPAAIAAPIQAHLLPIIGNGRSLL